MKGTKRFGQSESNIFDPSESTLRSKRVMGLGGTSPFDFTRAEPSRPAEQPSLDVQRAESSRQHVRALNTQFASWVQSQLKDHPDELWEDGVQDYIKHASHIMDTFSDVVAWLKANTAKVEAVSTVGSFGTENKVTPGTKNNEAKFQLPPKSVFGLVGSSPSFTSSWSTSSTSIPPKSPAPVLFGNQNPFSGNQNSFSGNQNPFAGRQNSTPINRGASDEEAGEDDVERPSSPSVKKTEEKGTVVVHEVKCKLYIKSTDPTDKDAWKDRGVGQLSIKCKEGVSKATKDSKPTIIVRNDVGKVLLNALIYPGIKTNSTKNSITAIFHTSGESSSNDGGTNNTVVARTYLIRTKNEEERNKLASAIQEYAPTA